MAGKPINRSRILVYKSRLKPKPSATLDAAGTQRFDPVASLSEHDQDAVNSPQQQTPATLEASPHQSPAPIDRRRFGRGWRRLRFLAGPLVWLCLLAFCGGTGVAAFLWLTTLPPLPNCQKLQPLSPDTDKLSCAEQAARSGKVDTLLAGLDLVKHWPADHPLSNRVKRVVKEWSTALLTLAQRKADQGDLAGAIALAQKIPANSPIHTDAQAAIQSWQQRQNRGQAIEAKVQAALKQQDWQVAAAQIQALAALDDSYARQHLGQLQQQLVDERNARQTLQQARQLVANAPANPAITGQAIALAAQIQINQYAYQDAQTDIHTWVQFLLNRLAEQVNQRDTAGALITAQALPLSLSLPAEARDLVWLGRAQPLVASKLPNQSPYHQLWQLWLTLPQVHHISTASPLYPQVQPLLTKLEWQTPDLLQIQAAIAIGNVKQLPTLQMAIGLVQAIAPNHPQRLYAQTLLAQWRKESQQIEDRPYLVKAQALAAAGTIPNLNAAIAQAQQIALGRALRLEAQTAIAAWTGQIQTLEDQPLLNQAQALAKQNKLADAIAIASKIRADRSLYKTAQANIQTWTGQLQLVVDRPLLDEANALAGIGSLTKAINLVSQIGPDRALYGEAQRLIGRWTQERDVILRARHETPYQPDASPRTEPYRTPYTPPTPSQPELPPP